MERFHRQLHPVIEAYQNVPPLSTAQDIGYDTLMDWQLSVQRDNPEARYVRGWICMEAAECTDDEAEKRNLREQAIASWHEVSATDYADILLRAKSNMSLAYLPQMDKKLFEQVEGGEEEAVYKGLLSLAARIILERDKQTTIDIEHYKLTRGIASELTFALLIARAQIKHGVPVQAQISLPRQDASRTKTQKFSWDSTVTTMNGSVQKPRFVQVKSSSKDRQRHKLYHSAITVVTDEVLGNYSRSEPALPMKFNTMNLLLKEFACEILGQTDTKEYRAIQESLSRTTQKVLAKIGLSEKQLPSSALNGAQLSAVTFIS